jgi:hypothetical protein
MRLGLLLFVIAFGVGCARTPTITDTVLEKAISPSGKLMAVVIKRDVGLLNDSSLLVFAGKSPLNIEKSVPVTVVTAGGAPSISFINDDSLQIRLFGGRIHSQRESEGGLSIVYK